MLPPSVEGRILQALQIDAGDQALEVGTGSGFFAACIAQLARTVRTIDVFEDFVATATANLYRTGVHNVTAATARRHGAGRA
jgi:protein-L-isoaspartate(D-aspartate) O-methyltransferase